MKRKVWLGAALLVLSAHSARAEMVEDIVQVPVTVKGKWVKVDGWDNAEAAKAEIVASFERAAKK